jgi:transmembrane sensor
MDQQRTSQDLRDAARWFARLRAPDCTPVEQQAFHSWIAADPAHAAAYQQAMTTGMAISGALRSDPAWQAMVAGARSDVPERQARLGALSHWLMRPLLAGALLLLCALVVDRAWLGPNGSAVEERYANAGPQRREVQLADGSRLWLDVGATVDVLLEDDARRLKLLAGRAYFQVAHDAARPFTVDAAGTRTTALGTEFEVDILETGIRVTLAQGAVSVLPTGTTAGWSRHLRPGQQLRSQAGHIPEVREVNVAAVTGWSTGTLRFGGVPLRDVVAEWNRYAQVRIVIGDEELGDSKVGGSFRAGGASSEFVEALAAVLPLRAVPAGAGEILLVRKYAEQ